MIVFSHNFLSYCRQYSTSSQACPIWRLFSTCNDQWTRLIFDAISSGFQEKKLHHLFNKELLLDFKASHLSPFFCYVRLKFGNCKEQTMSESRCNMTIDCDVFLFAWFVSRFTTKAQVKALASCSKWPAFSPQDKNVEASELSTAGRCRLKYQKHYHKHRSTEKLITIKGKHLQLSSIN